MAKKISGTKEWSIASVNCVTGCENDCRYCYARHDALTRYGGRIKSAAEWSDVKIVSISEANSFSVYHWLC